MSDGNGKLPKDIGKPSDNVLVDVPVNDQPDSNAVEFEVNVTTIFNKYFVCFLFNCTELQLI